MSLGKRSKDPYAADERIIDPKTRLAEERNIYPKICIRQMNESFTSRSFIYPKTRSGGEQLFHLPDRSLTRRHGREVNDSFICRIQIRSRSSFIFHVTCIGSALVASRSMIRSSFIFHVTCIGSALVTSRSMIRSSAGYESLDNFSRDLHRLSTGRKNRNDSFILTGSSDTDLWIIFHVTCIGSEEETERICLPRSLSRG